MKHPRKPVLVTEFSWHFCRWYSAHLRSELKSNAKRKQARNTQRLVEQIKQTINRNCKQTSSTRAVKPSLITNLTIKEVSEFDASLNYTRKCKCSDKGINDFPRAELACSRSYRIVSSAIQISSKYWTFAWRVQRLGDKYDGLLCFAINALMLNRRLWRNIFCFNGFY